MSPAYPVSKPASLGSVPWHSSVLAVSGALLLVQLCASSAPAPAADGLSTVLVLLIALL